MCWCYLIQHRDRVVSRDDLIASVWGGRIVSESTLSSRINSARAAIGDSGEQQQWIRTIARKGVRFIGDVRGTRRPQRCERRQRATGLARCARGQSVLPDKPSIAVLPFTNMSGDPEQEYFSDGITEDIITALSRLRWFFVIARNSAFAYKGKRIDVRQVGRELGVRYVLEGSVRRSGQRLRITGQLFDATTGTHIWSERYDRELTDIFALQDEITASVAAAIEPKLLAAEAVRSERRSAADLDAWDLVTRALAHYWRMTTADSKTAIDMLRRGGRALSRLWPRPQHAGVRPARLKPCRLDTGRPPLRACGRAWRNARQSWTKRTRGRILRSAISLSRRDERKGPCASTSAPSSSIPTSRPRTAIWAGRWRSTPSRTRRSRIFSGRCA